MTKLFQGSMVALVTPFKNGQVDEEALRKLVEDQIAGGTTVLVPCGTTGESATLTPAEHEQVISVVIDQVKKRVKVLAGAGSNSTREAVHLTEFCAKAGADGTLHITPYYNKPTQEGLYQHFQAIAKASDLPVILYNVPSRTGVALSLETIVRLSQIESIVGIKEASGSVEFASEIINNTPDNFCVLSGEDALTYPLYCVGADGVISVTANILPQKCAALFNAVQENKHDEALKLHNELLPIHQALFIETNPIPVKAALALMGKVEEEFRLPLVSPSKENLEKLKQVLKGAGLVF
ncbi:MAG: 4-hydroxy-tetrahydrodipicolinate synthase [Deltaproteobacteria bacterium]|nr:4-hydroxy-tetrahydrodipicolinate synthase [Deltaproteobacteria bacterium]